MGGGETLVAKRRLWSVPFIAEGRDASRATNLRSPAILSLTVAMITLIPAGCKHRLANLTTGDGSAPAGNSEDAAEDHAGTQGSGIDGMSDLGVAPSSVDQGCGDGTHMCSGACVGNSSVDHCGQSCDGCLTPAGGTPTCDGIQCGFDCGPLRRCGSRCVSGCCLDADCPMQAGKAGLCDTSTNTCEYQNCAAGYKPCGLVCIPAGACCDVADCVGVCMTCSSPGGSCVAVKNQADADSCPGICDGAGICRSKQGQTCLTTAAGCLPDVLAGRLLLRHNLLGSVPSLRRPGISRDLFYSSDGSTAW
jgi:hypothetical protein